MVSLFSDDTIDQMYETSQTTTHLFHKIIPYFVHKNSGMDILEIGAGWSYFLINSFSLVKFLFRNRQSHNSPP